MRSDSVKNVSAYADQNHAPSLADARLEYYSMACVSVPPPAGFYASDRLFQYPHLNRFGNMSIHTGCQRMLNIL